MVGNHARDGWLERDGQLPYRSSVESPYFQAAFHLLTLAANAVCLFSWFSYSFEFFSFIHEAGLGFFGP